jgi:hypothetical protein
LTETVFAICVAVLLIVLAIVIGVPPVTAGRDNLENPDPLNIAEFAIEHDESHQGSASDIRQARTPELALALGCQSEWFESGSAILRACAQRPMMTTCCHSSARVAHAVENVSVLALFFGRSSPEHSAGAFSRVWGNLPMVLMLPACKLCGLCCCLRLRLSLPVTVLNLIAV